MVPSWSGSCRRLLHKIQEEITSKEQPVRWRKIINFKKKVKLIIFQFLSNAHGPILPLTVSCSSLTSRVSHLSFPYFYLFHPLRAIKACPLNSQPLSVYSWLLSEKSCIFPQSTHTLDFQHGRCQNVLLLCSSLCAIPVLLLGMPICLFLLFPGLHGHRNT